MKRTLSLFICALVLVSALLAFGVSAETYYPDEDGLYTISYCFEPTSEYILFALKGEYDQTNYIEAYNSAPDNDIIYMEQKMSDEDGNVTFGPFAPNGYYDATLIVGGAGFEEPYLAGRLSATGTSNAASIEIEGVEETYVVKGINDADIVVEINAVVYDSFGYPSVTNEPVEITLDGNGDDVTLDGNVLTIDKAANEQTFRITAVTGNVSDEVYVQVKREESEAAYIEVYKNSSDSEPADSIVVFGPDGNFSEITVYAKTFTQYGEEMDDTYSYNYADKNVEQSFVPLLGTYVLKVVGSKGISASVSIVGSSRADYKDSALELYNLINECRELLAQEKVVSTENGKDVFPGTTWIAKTSVESFESAVSNAQTALGYYGTEGYYDADYADEVTALNKALTKYNEAFKDGIRKDVDSVSIEDQDIKVLLGSADAKNYELTWTTSPKLSSTTDKITWSSSDPTVATVENGVIKALKSGKVTITATTRGGHTAETEFLIYKYASNLSLSPYDVKAVYGGTPVVLTVGISPADTFNAIGWSVTEKDDYLDIVVSEDNMSCTIIPKKAGKATVTVKTLYGDKVKTASSTVTVEMPSWETATAPKASVESGSVLKGTKVSLETETAGAEIYYTLDGTVPSKDNGRLYKAPIAISQNLTLMAVAVGDGLYDSDVVTYEYSIVEGGVVVDSVSVRPGATAVLNVNLEGFVDVKNADVVLKYNASILTLTDVDYICEYVDEDSSSYGEGTVTLVLNKDEGFTYTGAAAALTFKVNENAPDGKYSVDVVTSSVVTTENITYNAAQFGGVVDVDDFILGDANGDGMISVADVLLMRQYVAGQQYAKDNIVLNAADVDADGDIDNDDIILLSKYCVGWNVTLG